MTRYFSEVHIAGQMIDGVQRCVRCQKVLIDYRGAMVAVMPGEPVSQLSGWAEGGYVAECGNQSTAIDHDAQEQDEMACKAIQVDLQ